MRPRPHRKRPGAYRVPVAVVRTSLTGRVRPRPPEHGLMSETLDAVTCACGLPFLSIALLEKHARSGGRGPPQGLVVSGTPREGSPANGNSDASGLADPLASTASPAQSDMSLME